MNEKDKRYIEATIGDLWNMATEYACNGSYSEFCLAIAIVDSIIKLDCVLKLNDKYESE